MEERAGKKDIRHTLIVLAIPTILEEILSTLLQYVDTAMVGHLGEDATAAVSVTQTISWLMHSIPGAIGIAVLAMIAKAIGSKDYDYIRKIARQTMILVCVFGTVLTVAAIGLSPFIPQWMGADVSIQREASKYFAIICIPMLLRTGTSVFAAAIRATKDTRTPMFINMGANGLNVILNYILIYVCDLGVTGAAIASAISYALGGIVMFVAFCRNPFLKTNGEPWKVDWSILRKCAQIGFPVLCTSTVSCFGYIVFASLVTGMGNTVFAAHSIAVSAETIFYIPGYGLRTATSTLVGISQGENDENKFHATARNSILLTISMMFVTGLLLFIVATPLMRIFSSSERVVEIGAEMLRLVAFSEPFFGLMIVMEGIYYGLGRTKYAFVVESFGMWGIRIVFTYLCVKQWGLSLRAVWYCMIADNITKAILLAVPLFTGHIKKAFNSEG